MQQPRERLDLMAMVILAVLCASWGLNQISIKVAIAGVSPVMQGGIRSLGATILVYLWMVLRRTNLWARDQSLGWGIAIGLLFSIEFVMIYWGLEFTNASRAVIFMYTMPFFTTLGAHRFIPAERMHLRHIIGLCCAFVGILVAFSESFSLPGGRMLIGDSMLLAAGLLWATVTVIIKASPLAKIPASKNLLYQLAVSAVALPVCSLLLGEPGVYRLTPLIAGCIFYQVIWVAFITYLLWFWLIHNYPASRLSSFLFLTPIFGVLEGALLLHEPVTIRLIVALVLVCAGIYVVNLRSDRKPSEYVARV